MEDNTENATVSVQNVKVFLSTQTQYKIPLQPYMIPATFRRYHLSQLINQVLALPNVVPFDFLIEGDMVIGTVGDACNEKGLNAEETIKIEYIPSVLPPENISTIPTKEWVSSVSSQAPGLFLAGFYDNMIRIYNESQEVLHTVGGHSGPISDASWVPSSSSPPSLFLSSSYDTTARIISYDAIENDTPKSLASMHLHTQPISSARADSNGEFALTASWDQLIGLWTLKIPEAHEVHAPEQVIQTTSRKRRKLGKGNGFDSSDADSNVMRKAPEMVLKSHTGRVSKALFDPLGRKEAWSAGWDCTVRKWDVETGICLQTVTSSERVMMDLGISADAQKILAASADRNILMYSTSDFGSKDTRPIAMPQTSSPIALTTHTSSPHHLIVAAQDGLIRLWDVRSTKSPVASFSGFPQKGEGESPNEKPPAKPSKKVICLDWGGKSGDLVLSGGEEGVCVSRASI
ncbi:ribosome biogenesis protein YTM1 [Cantharellus anzutake]|uniref:ribosome biogenesis protein YTM1 n=1 Tax=Cantharellus anzutake TaxID=1750568 RepID=UPI00190847D3|nr:ribosome biogenesis protein YTM1 [Cantharellus anzutake]KAF8343088.1 ribosome biogenesis protein YTM1 [Cantharellus anzutake]